MFAKNEKNEAKEQVKMAGSSVQFRWSLRESDQDIS